MDRIIVTTRENPDLDGVACSYAYAEFLNKKGISVQYAVFGTPLDDAKFIYKKARVPIRKQARIMGDEKIILTDTSIVAKIPKSIDPERVIEIVDHRTRNESSRFVYAKIQIEQVGAAATLITEKFMRERIKVSYESRLLLFYAIVSSTINFNNNVTTTRDIKAAKWLQKELRLNKNYLHSFFLVISKVKNLRKKMDIGLYEFPNTKICIGQLEIIDARKFISKNKNKIDKILKTAENEKHGKISLLTIIDIEKAENIFYSESPAVRKALEDIFKIRFKDNVAYRKGIIMRKELSPLLDEYFKKRLK